MIESNRTRVLFKFNGDAIECQTVSLPSPKPWQNVPFVYNECVFMNIEIILHIFVHTYI